MKQQRIYQQDGVDVSTGDTLSKYINSLARKTFTNNSFVEVDEPAPGFRGPRGYRICGLDELHNHDVSVMNTLETDGAGTKTVLYEAAGRHQLAAYDFAAMVLDDIAAHGGIPLLLANDFSVSSLKDNGQYTINAIKGFFQQLVQIMDEQNVVLFTGELAELGPCVASENPSPTLAYNVSGTGVGLYSKKSVITGAHIKPGQVVMALKENGFGSNGISSVRGAFQKEYGEQWYSDTPLPGERSGAFGKRRNEIEAAATPSVVYSKFISTINGWHNPAKVGLVPLYAIAHITGGGIVGKFAEDILFPNGVSAVLDNLWEPAPIVRQVKKMRGIPDDEVFTSWGYGQRMLVVIDERSVNTFTTIARGCGIDVKQCGVITKASDTPSLTIRSDALKTKELVYRA